MKDYIHLFTPVREGFPIAYQSGDWDGLKSDPVFVMDKYGCPHSAVMYEGILDGNKFKDFYDMDDMEIANVTHVLDLSKLTTKDSVIRALNNFKEDKVMPGCTFGDTEYDNPAVVYGKDIVIYGVKDLLNL